MFRELRRRAPMIQALVESTVLRYARRLMPELVAVTRADGFRSLPIHRASSGTDDRAAPRLAQYVCAEAVV